MFKRTMMGRLAVTLVAAATLLGAASAPAFAHSRHVKVAKNHTSKTITQHAGNGGSASANGGNGGNASGGHTFCNGNGTGIGGVTGTGVSEGDCNSIAAGGAGGSGAKGIEGRGGAKGGAGGSNINYGSQGDVANANAF